MISSDGRHQVYFYANVMKLFKPNKPIYYIEGVNGSDISAKFDEILRVIFGIIMKQPSLIMKESSNIFILSKQIIRPLDEGISPNPKKIPNIHCNI